MSEKDCTAKPVLWPRLEEVIGRQLKELVRGSVEETLNERLEAEAEKLTQAAWYERNEQRQDYRSGRYNRNPTTTSGDVTLKVPKLKGGSLDTWSGISFGICMNSSAAFRREIHGCVSSGSGAGMLYQQLSTGSYPGKAEKSRRTMALDADPV